MKKRMQNVMPYLFLGLLTLSACWLFAARRGVFGSKVDWISQHSVLPAYFRQLFYETGDLFPEFAANLGGGQNIFHFSYYGLFSPVILLSYLFPFIRMDHYLMAASAAELVLSAWLFYYWLGQKGFSKEIRAFVSVLFLLGGGPMIYHSCHQLMFVNYMPFLCMALLGVDRHLKENRSGLYILGILLMILSSFYFSICGMLVLGFYGFSQYVSQEQSFRSGKFFKDAFSFLFPMVTAVLMSGLLLVPTAFALLGRENAGSTDLAALFLPQIPAESLLYNCYGVGLPTFIFTTFLAGFTYRKWQERVLTYGCALIFVFPFFAWALNGGLYARGKSLIPFLPLLCYLIAVYLDKQKKREISFFAGFCAHLLTLALLYCCCQDFPEWRFLLADGLLTLVCFVLFWKFGRIFLLSVPPILFLLLFGCFGGRFWELEDPKTYAEVTNENIGALISQTLDEEPQLCRLEQRGPEGEKGADLNRIWDSRQWISSLYSSACHADYQKFWETGFQTEKPFRNSLIQASSSNPLYQKLMGVKYLVKNSAQPGNAMPPGYAPCKTRGDLTVYKNKNAAPIAYATDRVIPEQSWRRLSFPYNQIALMKYAVVKDAPDSGQWENKVKAWAKPDKLCLPQIDAREAKASYTADGTYHIQAKEKTSAAGQIEVPTRKWNTLLYLQFHVKNNRPSRDISIWVNGVRNRLSARSHIYYNGNTTFTYVSDLGEETRNVELLFGEGDYEISDIKCFLGDKRVLENETNAGQKLYQSKFQADRSRTKGNTIQGKISVKRTGWVITSIPYDSHFEVLVGKEAVNIEKVNGVFLGFAIKKGIQNIQITYRAPGARAGKGITCMGFLLCALILYRQRKRLHKTAPRERNFS